MERVWIWFVRRPVLSKYKKATLSQKEPPPNKFTRPDARGALCQTRSHTAPRSQLNAVPAENVARCASRHGRVCQPTAKASALSLLSIKGQ